MGETITTTQHDPPKRPVAEWVGVPDVIMTELAGWLVELPGTKVFIPPVAPVVQASSQDSVAARTVQQVLDIVQAVLQAAGINGSFMQSPPASLVRSLSGLSAPPPSKASPAQPGLEVEGKLSHKNAGKSMHLCNHRVLVLHVLACEPSATNSANNSVQHHHHIALG
jgi:hypothetical protein